QHRVSYCFDTRSLRDALPITAVTAPRPKTAWRPLTTGPLLFSPQSTRFAIALHSSLDVPAGLVPAGRLTPVHVVLVNVADHRPDFLGLRRRRFEAPVHLAELVNHRGVDRVLF